MRRCPRRKINPGGDWPRRVGAPKAGGQTFSTGEQPAALNIPGNVVLQGPPKKHPRARDSRSSWGSWLCLREGEEWRRSKVKCVSRNWRDAVDAVT